MSYKEEKKYLDIIDDMNKEIEEVRKRYKRKINNSLKRLTEIGGCRHHFYITHEEEHDDGFSRWWKVSVKTCKICKTKESYGKWPLGE